MSEMRTVTITEKYIQSYFILLLIIDDSLTECYVTKLMLQLMNLTCAKQFLPIVTKRVPSIIAGFFVSAKTLKTTLVLQRILHVMKSFR